MKKLLLTFSVILAIQQIALSQCTPDPGITQPGIYPDTIQNLPPAFETAGYGTTIQLKVITDTMTALGNVHVTNIVINSVIGLPSGFTYSCNPSNCTFPGGSNDCIYLSGTPSAGSAGTYNLTVNLTLNGVLFGFPVSQSGTKTGYKIVIHAKPNPNFSGSPLPACAGGVITFTDASSDLPASWNWSFPGGTPATSTSQSPQITYSTAGVYNATLMVGNPAGSNTLTKTNYVTVNALPKTRITLLTNDTICHGDTAKLQANGGAGLTYQWQNGAAVIPGATSQIYNAVQKGNFRVVVTNSNGCSKLSGVVKIAVSSVVATVTPAGPLSFCAGQTATLHANTGPGLTWQWKRNGIAINGATNSTRIVSIAGKYKCIVSTYLGCPAVSNTVTVTVPCREDGSAFVNNDYALYPNPASENAFLDFNVNESQLITVTIYDLAGRIVSNITSENYDAGNYQLILNTSELNAGVYFVGIASEHLNQTLRLNVQH